MEEFQEADILWPDHAGHRCTWPPEATPATDDHLITNLTETPLLHDSAAKFSHQRGNTDVVGAVMGIDVARAIKQPAAAIVPPHILAARRHGDRRAAFSVCAGQGRTLKGRDLCSVRNAVLRMTGFLEGGECSR